MKIYSADETALALPPGHRFPARKYSLLRRRVAEGLAGPGELLPSPPASEEELLRVHSRDYLDRVLGGRLSEAELRRIGFPWSPELVQRARRAAGATLAAARTALREGLGINLAGGTHHAFPDRGEGYCLFNDVAVALRSLLVEEPSLRALILDCDAHQGNGTAAIFAEEERVYTFSIHDAKNFPLRKERSDLDLALPRGADDGLYLRELGAALPGLFEAALPDLVVYLAGADPYSGDQFGRMGMSKEGLLERDALVLGACAEKGLSAVVVMAGGYARNIEDTVDIHAATVGLAAGMARAGRFGGRRAPRGG